MSWLSSSCRASSIAAPSFDWGISLFFLTPLAVVAIPQLRLRRAALVRVVATWLVISLIVLVAAPQIVPITMLRMRPASSPMAHIRSSRVS